MTVNPQDIKSIVYEKYPLNAAIIIKKENKKEYIVSFVKKAYP